MTRSRPSIPVALATTLLFAACERPFVPFDPPSIEVVSPDLSEVIEVNRIPLVLRVTSASGISDVLIDGQPATRVPGEDIYLDTLDVADGLNTFVVEAEGQDGNVTRDTLYALRLSLRTGLVSGAELPEARALHAAAALQDGGVLISGGVGPDGLARAEVFSLRETSPFTFEFAAAGALARPRASHTAHALPDGRVLVLGGSTRGEPLSSDDFIAEAEIIDPASGSSVAIPGRGDPILRSGHVSFLLTSAGRIFFYLFGGRGQLGADVGTPSSVVIAELRSSAGTDTLVTLTPPGGAGVLSPVTAPAGLLLTAFGGTPRAIVAGLYAPEALAVASRLVFLPGTSIYPFQVLEEFPEPPEEPRDDAAAVQMDAATDVALLLGGRDGSGVVSARITAYSDRAGRFFRVPVDRSALRVSRYGHTATLLPSGRIAVVGGFSVPGNPIAAAEVVYTD